MIDVYNRQQRLAFWIKPVYISSVCGQKNQTNVLFISFESTDMKEVLRTKEILSTVLFISLPWRKEKPRELQSIYFSR